MACRISIIALAFWIGFAPAQNRSTPNGPKKKEVPPAGYKKDNLRGFTLYFSDEVLNQDRASSLDRKPLEALERELIIVETVLPADKVKKLKAVPIWVEWNEHLAMKNGRSGQAVAVFYGGHQATLLGSESNPLKSNAVTILSLKSLTAEHQPKTDSGRCVTLHEFAHAFQHHFLGDNNILISSTYRQAMERKLYDPGLYVATNDHEYFAELTCAYLDRLHYFPRTREELKKHDPKAYQLMEKLWGKVPEHKAALAGKGPKLPSPDGEGQFPLTTSTEKLELGTPLAGELPTASARKGRPVLVMLFPAANARALALLPRLADWNSELQDFGLITIGAETSGAPSEAVHRIVRERHINFPIVAGVRFGVAGTFRLPHALVFDHTGKCIFRGAPLDAEPYLRIAVGKAVVDRTGIKSFGKAAQPVVDLLELGKPMSEVFVKLQHQIRLTKKDAADELLALDGALTAGGKRILDEAADKAKTDPISAFFMTERIPVLYRGTSIEKPAFRLVNKVKGNPKVEWELRARGALVAVKKLDTQLSGKELSFDPRLPEFKDKNVLLLKQLADAIAKVLKAYPTTRAADEAVQIAERWDIKLK